MKKIAVVTTTRAEFGLLCPVIKELREYEEQGLLTELIVSGTHLYEEYGMTVNEIENTGLRIDEKVRIPVVSETELDISLNQADALVRFTELFSKKNYDGIVVLGDRYEMLAVAVAAGNTRTPVFHLCGGDTTEGAIDEWVRHSITKISYLHFPSNEESRKRVIQMGEDPSRVFNYGSPSIDNILRTADMSREEALASVGLSDCRYALCTYHPVTMQAEDNLDRLLDEFLSVIRERSDLEFIITKSNADQGGARINRILDEEDALIPNLHVFSSLGVRRYLSLMKYAEFVLGNSSSGIIETPAFGIPTVNIGNRQRGRLQAESILNCGDSAEEIASAVDRAMDPGFKAECRKVVSPYGDGNAAVQIAAKIFEIVTAGSIDLRKSFYNLTF